MLNILYVLLFASLVSFVWGGIKVKRLELLLSQGEKNQLNKIYPNKAKWRSLAILSILSILVFIVTVKLEWIFGSVSRYIFGLIMILLFYWRLNVDYRPKFEVEVSDNLRLYRTTSHKWINTLFLNIALWLSLLIILMLSVGG